MITRAQQILLKQAQQQAALADAEYRDAIALISGAEDCRSSKDRRLNDAHVDKLMSYFEAIYWRKVDSEALKPVCKPTAPFRQRGYWSQKNTLGNTSRDRYTDSDVSVQIGTIEGQLAAMGYGARYCAAIRARIIPFAPRQYLAALTRTLAAKQRTAGANDDPY